MVGIEQKAKVMEVVTNASLHARNERHCSRETLKYLNEFGDGIADCRVEKGSMSISVSRSFFTRDARLVDAVFPTMVEGLMSCDYMDFHISCNEYSLALIGLPQPMGIILRGEEIAVSIYKEESGPIMTPADLGKQFAKLVRDGAVGSVQCTKTLTRS